MISSIRYLFLAVVFAAALPGQAALTPQEKGGVTCITGGVGVEERQQLKGLEKDFNLKLCSRWSKATSFRTPASP